MIANVLAIFVRDFKPALDVFYPTEAALDSSNPLHLPDFRERTLGQVLGLEAPMLGINPNRNAASPSADASHMKEALKLELAIGVTDDSPANVTQRVMRYTRTAVAVLHSTNKSDYFVNMSSPFGFVLETESIYRPIRGNGNIYFRDSTVELTIEIRER